MGQALLSGLLALPLLVIVGVPAKAQSGLKPDANGTAASPGSAFTSSNEDLLPFSNGTTTDSQRALLVAYREEQKQVARDMDRLLQLAARLNAEVASEHAARLTPEQRREAAEIEKLARSIRSKELFPVPLGLIENGPFQTTTIR